MVKMFYAMVWPKSNLRTADLPWTNGEKRNKSERNNR